MVPVLRTGFVTYLLVQLVSVQLLHLRTDLALRCSPILRFGEAQTAVREVTGGAWALVRSSCQLAVGVLNLAARASVGVIKDIDGGCHSGILTEFETRCGDYSSHKTMVMVNANLSINRERFERLLESCIRRLGRRGSLMTSWVQDGTESK